MVVKVIGIPNEETGYVIDIKIFNKFHHLQLISESIMIKQKNMISLLSKIEFRKIITLKIMKSNKQSFL